MSVPVNADDRGFRSEPDPENPGWFTWQLNDSTRFNSWMFPKLLVRADSDGKARLRMFPEHRHTNLGNNIHGGTVMALIDIALFACARQLGIIEAGTAVTLDLSVQFIGAGVGMYDTAKAAGNGGLERAINTLNSLLNNGITATVSPVDATHAAAQAPVTR